MELMLDMHFDEDQIKEIERLAALGYSLEKMAIYFNQPLKLFKAQASQPPEEINRLAYHIQRGKLRSIAFEDMKVLEKAESGNVAASQQLINIKRDRSWSISRAALLQGPDPETFKRLEDYFLNIGDPLNDDEEIYFDSLYIMIGLYRKHGKQHSIDFFIKRYKLRPARARQMFEEAINLFYIDNSIDKKAYRNHYADQLEEVAHHIKSNIRNSQDAERFAKLIKEISILRQLDKEDPPSLPAEAYMKPIRIHSLDPTVIELPAVNRHELARQIDEDLEIPEKDKLRLKNEALIEPFNFIERLHELQEESQDQKS